MSDQPDDPGALTFGGISFTAEGVCEGPVTRPTVAVRRQQIEHIRLRYGFLAHHPLLLGLFGLVLVGLGIAPIIHAVILLNGFGVFVDKEALLVLWLFLGVPALYQASRRGYVLDVYTTGGIRKLELDRGVEPSELERFLQKAEKVFGFSIERANLLES
jgi:hypothetical protein